MRVAVADDLGDEQLLVIRAALLLLGALVGRRRAVRRRDAAPCPAAASTGLSLVGGAVAPNTQHGPATIAAGRSCGANSYCASYRTQ
jgi:hypothetical protein